MMHRKKSMTCAILLGMMSMSVPNVAGRQQLMPVYHKLNAEGVRINIMTENKCCNYLRIFCSIIQCPYPR